MLFLIPSRFKSPFKRGVWYQIMPQGRVCGLPGSGTAGNEKGAPAVQKRGGVQHIKLLLLGQDEKSEAKRVKQVFGGAYHPDPGHAVKDGSVSRLFLHAFRGCPTALQKRNNTNFRCRRW